MSIRKFLKVATRDIRVGAVMPSSRWAVARIMANVPPHMATIIEYGPGDGVLTRRLLERLDPRGRLLAIETNPEFVRTLGTGIADPRFVLMDGDATRAAAYAAERGLPAAELVISGIPFSMLSHEQRRQTVEMTWSLLAPGGTFLVYQTSPLMLPYLKKRFRVKTSIELRNVPPYFVMVAKK